MKIGFWEIDNQEKKDYLSNNLQGYELVFFKEALNEDTLPQDIEFDVISIFTNSRITSKIIHFFPNLKLITVRATGFDNIDLKTANERGIPVCNVPAYGSHTVAEYTFGLILSLSRHIPAAVNRLKISGNFSFEGLRGFDLNNKTLGVIGTGKIGQNVIKIAKGFNMQVIAADNYPNNEAAASLGFIYQPLEEVLKQSDIVTLHVPYMPETHHLINRRNIFLMKKDSLLINTARGPVVETDALFQAITGGHLAGAGLDVIEEEVEIKEEAQLLEQSKMSTQEYKTILEDHLLINLPQVIVTPHMAFYTKEAEETILETTVKNIQGLISGNLENVVKA
ncbi:hydroxyacid dehydrogenase [Candidatus Daviesbacteria bacterium]|nr:hydroxyacid dehydrogenase [Candidatus Daviesbacteria bacterium]